MILRTTSIILACSLAMLSLAASATSLAESSPVLRGVARLEGAGRSLRLTCDEAGPLSQIDTHDGDTWHPLLDQAAVLVFKGGMVLIMLSKKAVPGERDVTESGSPAEAPTSHRFAAWH